MGLDTVDKRDGDRDWLLRRGRANFLHCGVDLQQIIDANVCAVGKPGGDVIVRDHKQRIPARAPIPRRQLQLSGSSLARAVQPLGGWGSFIIQGPGPSSSAAAPHAAGSSAIAG